MIDLLAYFVWILIRLIIPLRYRVKVEGWDQLRDIKGPVLLLPNHPGMVDPILVLSLFFGVFRPRTVLYEGNFPVPIRGFFIRLIRAVPVPDLNRPSQAAHLQVEQAIAEVAAGLRRGENFVIWPSGRAQRDGVERLGAASALTEILRDAPDASIVLVRTRGIWGSMFSIARHGRLPHLGQCLLNSALLLASNLFFFMPRRSVKVTLERIDRRDLPELERDSINRWFENRYNVEGPETPTYVPYHFLFGPANYQFPQTLQQPEASVHSEPIRSETQKAVTKILADRIGRSMNPNELTPETRLESLGLDSLQRMDLTLAVEQHFNISTDSSPETFGQLLQLAEGLSGRVPREAPRSWFKEPARVEPVVILGDTIPEAFVARALKSPSDVAAADDISGVMTYESLLIGSLIMARRFKKLPGVNVGLMLPASVASDVMLLGLYLANKLPVLLNWTTGPGNLRHSIELTNLKHVITSRQLVDRLGISIDGVELLYVEDLHRNIGWVERIVWFVLARCLPGVIRQRVPRPNVGAQAVILFTSGSEKAPKGVPLSHQNILSNVRIVPAVLDLTNRDSIIGFLPMFHSFGFTVTSLFPILTGVRVVHHADPTDVAAVIRKIATYRPTVLVGIPSIIGHLFDRAQPGELDSLKVIAVGAEACPATLYQMAKTKAPNAILLEGYGVTECSPLIAGNRPNANRIGTIGMPLPEVEVIVKDLDSENILPQGQMGMLLVSGPGVFAGYLGEEPSPFVNLNGRRWYATGDLVNIDSDGFIHFCGRLKRFIKAGGEMISLPALEEPFTRKYPADEHGAHVAVEGIETAKGRKIVLFTTEPLTLDDANSELSQSGFRGVMRLDEVRQLDKIPKLGTGKTDYRQLRAMIGEND